MITLGLAYINAKYDSDYELLFLFTFWLDYNLISSIASFLTT